MDDKLKKGQILKQARETKGITLESVHEATKIPLDALKAIEEGYSIRSMTPFYYRGFLKIYTKYLGIDVGQVVEDIKKETVRENNIPSYFASNKDVIVQKNPPLRLSPELKLMAIRILVALVALFLLVKSTQAIGRFWSNRPVRVEAKKSVNKAKAQAKAKLPVKVEKTKIPEEPVIVKEVEVAVKEAPKIAEEPKKEETKNQSSHKKIDLAIRAMKDSWVQVKVDGDVVLRSTLRKGTVETWHAKKTMDISGKDIGTLEFELNGKIIGPLSKENRRAKKVLIDLNGFTVK
jgi:cytoskeletal protein RodZ